MFELHENDYRRHRFYAIFLIIPILFLIATHLQVKAGINEFSLEEASIAIVIAPFIIVIREAYVLIKDYIDDDTRFSIRYFKAAGRMISSHYGNNPLKSLFELIIGLILNISIIALAIMGFVTTAAIIYSIFVIWFYLFNPEGYIVTLGMVYFAMGSGDRSRNRRW